MAKKRTKTRPVAAQPATIPARSHERFLWPILGAALLLRLIYWKFSQDSPFYEPALLDARYYQDWAIRIARGDYGNSVFYGLPLYPFFLGCVYLLTHESLVAAKFVQILLGLVTVFYVYRTGEKIAGGRVAVLSALIAACYGPLIFHEGIFIPEALGVPLYAAAFFHMLEFLDGPKKERAIRCGVLLGLAMLTKAGVLLFVMALLGSLFIRKDAKARAAKKFAWPLIAAFFLTLAPVTAHNLFRGKDMVWLTSHSGFNFYVGNNPKAEGVFNPPEGTGGNVDAQIEDSREIAETAMGRPLKPSEVSRFWSDKAWAFIRNQPGRFFELCGRKLVLFFDSREISDVDDYQFASLFNPFLRIPWPNFNVLGPLFFVGLIVGFKRLKHRKAVVGWIGGYLLGMMAFFVNARYRLPLLPVMVPVAAVGALALWDDFVEWRMKRWLPAVSVLVIAILLTQWHLVGTDFSRDYVNAGDVWLEKGDARRALPLYDQALKISPDSPKANLAKALALTKIGMTAEARPYYEKCLNAEPENAQALNNLALWHEGQGDIAMAERMLLRAIELKPRSPQAHNNLGMVYGKSGRLEEAVREFETSIALNPRNPRTYTNLGLIYHLQRDDLRARQMWEKALQIDPNFQEASRALQLSQKNAG